jgi:hypothetical protein
MADETDPADTQAESNAPKLEEAEGEGWVIQDGEIRLGKGSRPFRSDGIEPLTYDNPFSQDLERVWYDGKIVFALDCGEIDLPAPGEVKVAKEYQPVYAVELGDDRKAKGEPEMVPGQYNIYDSVPGEEAYSPIWQFYYVVVPRDYQPNTLRSAQDCESSGYRIQQSNDFEN